VNINWVDSGASATAAAERLKAAVREVRTSSSLSAEFPCEDCDRRLRVNLTLDAPGLVSNVRVSHVRCINCGTSYTVDLDRGAYGAGSWRATRDGGAPSGGGKRVTHRAAERLEELRATAVQALDEMLSIMAELPEENAGREEVEQLAADLRQQPVAPAPAPAAFATEAAIEALEKAVRRHPSMASFLLDVALERVRQSTEEGFDDDHDDEHTDGALAVAAAAYAVYSTDATVRHPDWTDEQDYPWPEKDTRSQGDDHRRLVVAGALLVAEVERLTRRRAHLGDQPAAP
jgi:transcription elongation factor Elf1